MVTELESACVTSGITLAAVHNGLRTKNADGSPITWAHDEWSVTITRNGQSYSTSYRSGLGLRKLNKHRLESSKGGYREKYGSRHFRNLTDVCESSGDGAKLVFPSLADVLYCLLSDARSAENTFESWAADMGLDTDSRKAFDTYQECIKTRSAMVRVLGTDLLEKLSGLEH